MTHPLAPAIPTGIEIGERVKIKIENDLPPANTIWGVLTGRTGEVLWQHRIIVPPYCEYLKLPESEQADATAIFTLAGYMPEGVAIKYLCGSRCAGCERKCSEYQEL